MTNPSLVVRIAASLAEFKQNLAEGRNQIEATSKGMKALESSFSGDKITRAAHDTAAAVQSIGGASKLTEAEQRKVNRTVTEAIEKYKALGKDAPDALKQLQKETAGANEKTSLLSGGVKTMATAFAGLLTVNAIKGAISSTLEFTGKLTDLSGVTGLSAESIQRMQYVMSQSGVSMEQMADGVVQLSKRLAGDDKAAAEAVASLGLNINQLIASGPEQAFLTIGEAIAGVPNPMQRAALATEIFGKSGANFLPGFTTNMKDLAAQAQASGAILSEDMVASGDAAGDAIARLEMVGASLIAKILIPMMPAIEAVANWLGTNLPLALKASQDGVDWLLQKGLAFQAWLLDLAVTVTQTVTDIPVLGKVFGMSAANVGELEKAAQQARDTLNAFVAQGSEPAKKSVEAATQSTGTYTAATRTLTDAQKAAKKEADNFKKAQDSLFGRDLIAKAGDYVKQLGDVSNVSQLSKEKKEELRKAVEAALDAYKRLGQQAPPALQAILTATTPVITATRDMSTNLTALKGTVTDTGSSVHNLASGNLQEMISGLASAGEETRNWANDFGATLAPAMTGSMGAFTGSLNEAEPQAQGFFGKVFGGAQGLGNSLTSTFQAAFTGGGGALGAAKGFATQAVGSLMGMIPVVGPFISQFAGPLVAGFSKMAGQVRDIFRDLFGGPSRDELNGRNLVREFEDSMIGLLNTQQRAEAGGERWAEVTIAVRDAYIAQGRSAAEAEQDVGRLFASSQQGAEASRAVIAQIQAAMQSAGSTAVTAVQNIDRALDDLPRNVNIPVNIETRRTGDRVEGYSNGSDGIRDFGAGTLAVLHGRERVQTESQMMAERRNGGSGGSGADLSAALDRFERVLPLLLRDAVQGAV